MPNINYISNCTDLPENIYHKDVKDILNSTISFRVKNNNIFHYV